MESKSKLSSSRVTFESFPFVLCVERKELCASMNDEELEPSAKSFWTQSHPEISEKFLYLFWSITICQELRTIRRKSLDWMWPLSSKGNGRGFAFFLALPLSLLIRNSRSSQLLRKIRVYFVPFRAHRREGISKSRSVSFPCRLNSKSSSSSIDEYGNLKKILSARILSPRPPPSSSGKYYDHERSLMDVPIIKCLACTQIAFAI